MNTRSRNRAEILFLTNGYPDFPGSYRGHFVRRMAREIRARGYGVVVVTPRVYRRSPLFEWDKEDFGVFRFPFPSGDRPLIERTGSPLAALTVYLLSGLRCAYHVARSHGCRLVHVHWVVPTGLIGVSVGRLLGIPVLVHAMGTDIHTAAVRNPLFRALTRGVLRSARRCAAVSHDLSGRMRELCPDLREISVVPNGIDTHRFRPGPAAPARSALHLPLERRFLLFVGGLVEAKGILVLQQALGPVLERHTEMDLVVVGEGPLRTNLEEWARKSSLSGRIRILGRVPPHRMPHVYRASDLFILPSYNEGLPNALLEAMASGLPCIATEVGDIPRVLRPARNGLLVPPGDADALARALRQVLEDPELARRMKRAAVDAARMYDEQRSFRKVEALYRAMGVSPQAPPGLTA